MEQMSIDVLLEFLYKFAITSAFCFFGTFIREFLNVIKASPTNNQNTNKNKTTKIVLTTVFSSILMCACADYVNMELHIEVYAILSIVLGMWGFEIMRCIVDRKFIKIFFGNVTKIVANPIAKNAIEIVSNTAEKYNEDTNNENDKKE